MIKPYLPPQFEKLVDISYDSKNFLVGDSIVDAVESLRKETQTKSLLRDQNNLKRKHLKSQQEPSNYHASSKSQKRISDQGQNQRRSAKSYSRQQTQEITQNNEHQFRHTSQHTNIPTQQYTKHHKRKY